MNRAARGGGLAAALALAVGVHAHAGDVAASAPRDLSVTVYRAPYRGAGSMSLAYLGGFGLISETRTVDLPAGLSRLRFEGVADGIEPASAILTGLPSGVIEKNRDAHLLSPSALVALSVGQPVVLVRRRPKVTAAERVEGRILSDAEGGVVFAKAEGGIEALRCSGLSETFSFSADTPGLSARPTLSVLIRTTAPVRATVTLTYIAGGFDWSADYVADLAADGGTLDLGAWLTLANANSGSFPSARTQVVAGRVNHATGQVEPIDRGEPILARCWPRGSTSDIPQDEVVVTAARITPPRADVPPPPPLPIPPMMAPAPAPPAKRVAELEQLGDLKLYRTPFRTTVAAEQSKQVRLLDRTGVVAARIYRADLTAGANLLDQPLAALLQTRDDEAHHLGVPLPSGRVAVFQHAAGRRLLIAEPSTRDLAVGEKVEWPLGPALDVRVRQIQETRTINAEAASFIPVIPGVLIARSAPIEDVQRIEVSNAETKEVQVELRVSIPAGAVLAAADHPAALEDGKQVFRLSLAAGASATVRYRTSRAAVPNG